MDSMIKQKIRGFAQTVALNKGRAYIVGGAVRDHLLGRQTRDIDIEVHGIDASALRAVVESHFKQVDDIGIAFGILQARVEDHVIDVSLPRTDSKVSSGHKGFDIHVDPHMGLEQAARRRDFTINAMFMDILTEEVIDTVGGKADLDACVLRMVDDATFRDDPLRVLRGVQMVARFDLAVEKETQAAMLDAAQDLAEISDDRRRDEWRKVFLYGATPSRGLELARQVGAFLGAEMLIEDVHQTMQDPEWHPEGSVWAHTLWGADEVAKIAEREALSDHDRLSVHLGNLCHDIAKPESTFTKDGHVRSSGHADAGVHHVATVLSALGLLHLAKEVEPLVKHHHAPMYLRSAHEKEEDTDGAIKRLARAMRPSSVRLLALVSEADLLSRGPYPDDMDRGVYVPETAHWLATEARRLGVLDTPPPDTISGRDLLALGLTPGPVFGHIVHAANTLHDEDRWTRERILEALKNTPGARQWDSQEAVLTALRARQ